MELVKIEVLVIFGFFRGCRRRVVLDSVLGKGVVCFMGGGGVGGR